MAAPVPRGSQGVGPVVGGGLQKNVKSRQVFYCMYRDELLRRTSCTATCYSNHRINGYHLYFWVKPLFYAAKSSSKSALFRVFYDTTKIYTKGVTKSVIRRSNMCTKNYVFMPEMPTWIDQIVLLLSQRMEGGEKRIFGVFEAFLTYTRRKNAFFWALR